MDIKKQSMESIAQIRGTFDKYKKVISDVSLLKFCGKVKEVIGSMIISEGPFAKLGDVCRIYKNDDTYIDGEVIGFRNQDVLLSVYGTVNGITFGNMVYSFDKPLSVVCSEGDISFMKLLFLLSILRLIHYLVLV